MQRYHVMGYDTRGEQLFGSTLEAPNKAVAQMMALSQLCQNFTTAPLVDRADKLVVRREGEKADG
jgi:lipopolysaccharide biosynthesis regulator YciM